jgi:hypothetical protein
MSTKEISAALKMKKMESTEAGLVSVLLFERIVTIANLVSVEEFLTVYLPVRFLVFSPVLNFLRLLKSIIVI